MLNYPALSMIDPQYTLNQAAVDKYIEWLKK